MKLYPFFLLFFLLSCGTGDKEEYSGGICLSFDDRSVKEWYALQPLLNTYEARVTFFVTQFDSLSREEVNMLLELQKNGHEIGSHGAMHVVSEFYIREHSYSAYLEKEINQSIASMERKGISPTSFAYPYGAKYWFTDFLLLRKFKMLRGVAVVDKEKGLAGMDHIFHDFDNDRTVDAVGIDAISGLTKEMLQEALNKAKREQKVLMLVGHLPQESANPSAYSFSVDLLRFILAEAKSQGLKFYRISDLAKP